VVVVVGVVLLVLSLAIAVMSMLWAQGRR